MSHRIIAGIDPSLSCTAIAVWDGSEVLMDTIATRPYGKSVEARMKRLEYIAARMMRFLTDHDVVASYIEGYAFASNQRGHSEIVELGGILRWHLTSLGTVKEVAPATLKKFATSKGNAPKDMVAANLTARYGVLFDENNSYDAYGLVRLGMVAEGIDEAATAKQQEAADTVTQSRG